MDAQWSDDLHHALHVWLTGEKHGYYADYEGARDVAKALEWGYVYDGQRAPSRGRRHGRRYDERPSKLLGYAQTHDQVGNRARGERLSDLTSTDRAKIAAALVATSPFTPMLFMGEEWAATTPFPYFTDHDDPELARAIREGRRREHADEDAPDPQDPETFAAAKLDWSERARAPHNDVLAFHAALYRLRRTHPALREDAFGRARAVADGRVVVAERGPLVVIANLGPAATLPVEDASAVRLVLASSPRVEVEGVRVHLPADTVAILERA
jgi:maltooligosyltrehalose trehalohydrolase